MLFGQYIVHARLRSVPSLGRLISRAYLSRLYAAIIVVLVLEGVAFIASFILGHLGTDNFVYTALAAVCLLATLLHNTNLYRARSHSRIHALSMLRPSV